MRVASSIFVALVISIVGGCEKYELDRKMEELCKQDGGVKVYETVTLPASYFDEAGRIRLGPVMTYGESKPNRRSTFQRIGTDEYRIVSELIQLKEGDPLKGEGVLVRSEQRVVRMNDMKVLGVAVSYSRAGGDFIVVDHWSSASCPTPAPQLLLSVFTREL